MPMCSDSRNRIATLIVFAALASLPHALSAQSSDGTVSVSGEASQSLAPQTLRVFIPIISRADHPRAAMEQFTKRKPLIAEKLKELGADVDSIRFQSPRISESVLGQQAQYMEMMRERLGARFQQLESQLKTSALVSHVMAEWPIDGTSDDERMLAILDLEEKITEAEVENIGADASANQAQAEMLAEMEAFMGGGPSQSQQGKPIFQYVARPTPEQLDQIAEQAAAQARRNAERLAKAVGKQLGAIVSVSSGGPAAGADPIQALRNMYNPYGGMAAANAQQILAEFGLQDTAPEIASDVAGQAPQLKAAIHVEFALQ